MTKKVPPDTKTYPRRSAPNAPTHPRIVLDSAEEERTEFDETRFKEPEHEGDDEGEVTEFKRSLQAPLKTDMLYRRVVATAQQAFDYYQRADGTFDDTRAVEVEYGKLRVVAQVHALEKMHGWVKERSAGFTVEVQGRFLARRRPDHILVDDFIPLPSFCQSLAYETESPGERAGRFGKAKMRTISPDDWKPHETRFYEELGVFSRAHQITFDPLKVQIPFHSHYTKSLYQKGPSPGDTDHLHHLKWLYAPVTGLNILYSGVQQVQATLPHAFDPVAVDDDLDDEQSAVNPADCRVSAKLRGHVITSPVPLDPEGLVIGRDATCTFAVADDSLSRRHAKIAWGEDGLLRVEDLGSKNGTFLDGKRVTKPTVVRRPASLRVGECELEIRF